MSLWHIVLRQPTSRFFGVDVAIQLFDQLIGPFPPGTINRHSHVLVSICEVSQPAGEPLDFPFIGAATMSINNVCPRDDDMLQVRISINWMQNPLNYRLWIEIVP
jgi:hypothetical protein